MDDQVNNEYAEALRATATRLGLVVTIPTRAQFTSGGEGFSVGVRPAQAPAGAVGNLSIATFYNDDEYGPRWIGMAGRRVPADRLLPYLELAAAKPGIHPAELNYKILGS